MAATTLAPLDELHEREVAFNVSVCVRANESVALAGRQGYKLAPHLLRQMDHVTITLHPPSHPCVAAVALSVPLHHSSTHSLTHSLPSCSLSRGTEKIPTPLLLNTHGASVRLHLPILVTGSVCLGAYLWGINGKQPSAYNVAPIQINTTSNYHFLYG